jgi:hypothetical protein
MNKREIADSICIRTMEIYRKGMPEDIADQEKIVEAAEAFVALLGDPTDVHIHDAFLNACEGVNQATVIGIVIGGNMVNAKIK